jgi:methionyl-tRNA formyltransferase
VTLRVVFAGTPSFAAVALEAIAARHDVVGVLTQPDRPAGRGRALQPGPVKAAALERGLPVLQPQSLRGDAPDTRQAIGQLLDWAPDVMVVVAYGLLLPGSLLRLPRFGCLNIHASLLPRWRGAAPIQRAILAGDAESGVTIMQMDEGLDTGPMLLRRSCPIGPSTVAGELHDTLAALGGSLVVEALDGLEAGRLQPLPQPHDGVTYASKLSKAEGLIDWQSPVASIDRQIRAFNPWPAAQAVWRDEPVKLLRSCVLAAHQRPPGVAPGTVLGLRDGLLEVAAVDGVLGVGELQRAGRRAVSATDFANAEVRAGSPAVFA